jgi:hypothetical protein
MVGSRVSGLLSLDSLVFDVVAVGAPPSCCSGVVVVLILAIVAFDVWAFVVVALSVEVVVGLLMVARVMAVKGIVMFLHCSI